MERDRGREEEWMCVCIQPGPQDPSVAMVTPTIWAHEAKAQDLREKDGVRPRKEMSYGDNTSLSLSLYLSCIVSFWKHRLSGEEGEGHACLVMYTEA